MRKSKNVRLLIVALIIVIASHSGFGLFLIKDSSSDYYVYADDSSACDLIDNQGAKRVNLTSVYTNPDTGFVVVIVDDEDLLTENEEKLLTQDMIPLTEYGNVAFVSCYASGTTTERYANNWYYEHFGNESGSAFVIDMYNRVIQITSAGYMYSIINKGYANTITDNIYKYATEGEYYECASNAYSQELTLMEGGRVAMPMKHITNLLVALTIALLANYLLARYQRGQQESPEAHVFNTTTFSSLSSSIVSKKKVRTVTYDDSDDYISFGGGFSGGGFSGGGGGGGFSGGGGGHSF